MNVKTTQQTKHKKKSDFWRREYIRLLTEPAVAWTDLTPEHIEELEHIDDLIKAGYFQGTVIRDSNNDPKAASTMGPTLAGRIFAEEQQEILDKKSLWGRIKSGSVVFISWLAGIISAVIIWRLTR